MGISVIIPSTGERVEVLLETIAAGLLSLNNAADELIVIKNKAKRIDIEHAQLRLVDVEFNNVSASRNMGAQLARNEQLVFIDDDMLISAENTERFLTFEANNSDPYLLTAVWVHSDRVESLKATTFLGHMLSLHLPNDSFKTRYQKVSSAQEWQDNAPFKSAMTNVFWEACFSMRRTDYLRVGGMNEHFDFGNEGADFLQRVLEAKIGYYVDPINIIIHNEWDKFNDWRIPEKRWRTEAQLVNDDKAIATYSSRAYLYKLVYGVLIHAFALPIRMLLRAAPVKSNYLRFYFKLFDIYSTAIFWHQIKWRTIQRLQAQ